MLRAFLALLPLFVLVNADYEDKRCTCICPLLNSTDGKGVFAKKDPSVPPNKCTCEYVVLPTLGDAVKGKEGELCPKCQCKYENRNTTIIKVVVIIVIWVVSLLIIYMLFLMCLDPLLNKRIKRRAYEEHQDEEEEPHRSYSLATREPPSSVLNRVGEEASKWKREVQEQRRNIYDRHSILN